MGTIATPNPGIADLLQILSNSGGSSLSSTLSSPQIQSALQKAPPGDLVQLSDQALQLQEASVLFGGLNPSQTSGLFSALSPPSSSATLDNLLSALYSSSPGSNSSSSPTSSSLASQIATYRGELQAEQAQALLGTGTTDGSSGTLVNVLG